MRKKLIEYRGGRTQREMAEKYNVSQQTWSAWESGGRLPKFKIMLALERDSGIPIKSLFLLNKTTKDSKKGRTTRKHILTKKG